jgi:hypothetical protein
MASEAMPPSSNINKFLIGGALAATLIVVYFVGFSARYVHANGGRNMFNEPAPMVGVSGQKYRYLMIGTKVHPTGRTSGDEIEVTVAKDGAVVFIDKDYLTWMPMIEKEWRHDPRVDELNRRSF